MTKPFAELDARSLAQQFRRGTLSPTDCIDYQAQLCQAHNHKLRALIHPCYDLARKNAQSLLATASQAGQHRGRLFGVSFSAKDSIDVDGLPVGDGGMFGRIAAAASNALLTKLLLEEGALCIGKGNMSEYGKSFITDNKILGPSLNPFDLTRSAGGSSGGDAAAVAANFAKFALVSDMGGSARIPANFCGLFGLLPTRGLFSAAGMSHSAHGIVGLLRSHGVIAGSLDDIELLFTCLKSFTPEDPFSVPEALTSDPTAAKRIGVISALGGIGCHSDIQIALQELSQRAKRVGVQVVQLEPACFRDTAEAFITLGVQAVLQQEDFLAIDAGHPRQATQETVGLKNTRARLKNELPALDAERILRLWRQVDELRCAAMKLFRDVDVIVSPVCAVLPPRLDSPSLELDGKPLAPELASRFAYAANILGLTALAFPTHLGGNGLPIGLQIMGPRYSEKRCISSLRQLGYEKNIKSPIS